MAAVALGEHEAAVDELSQMDARRGGRDDRPRRQHAGAAARGRRPAARSTRRPRIADEGAHPGEIGVPSMPEGSAPPSPPPLRRALFCGWARALAVSRREGRPAAAACYVAEDGDS